MYLYCFLFSFLLKAVAPFLFKITYIYVYLIII